MTQTITKIIPNKQTKKRVRDHQSLNYLLSGPLKSRFARCPDLAYLIKMWITQIHHWCTESDLLDMGGNVGTWVDVGHLHLWEFLKRFCYVCYILRTTNFGCPQILRNVFGLADLTNELISILYCCIHNSNTVDFVVSKPRNIKLKIKWAFFFWDQRSFLNLNLDIFWHFSWGICSVLKDNKVLFKLIVNCRK